MKLVKCHLGNRLFLVEKVNELVFLLENIKHIGPEYRFIKCFRHQEDYWFLEGLMRNHCVYKTRKNI